MIENIRSIFVAAANRVVEFLGFEEFVMELKSCYCVPGQNFVTKEIHQLLLNMKKIISKGCKKTDIWTKCGMSSSYFGKPFLLIKFIELHLQSLN